MLERLDALAKTAAEKIKSFDFARVFSHHDADGITAAGIICLSLLRKKIPFQATFLSKLDEEAVKDIEGNVNVIFCDMGSGQTKLLSHLKSAVIVDHHKPVVENAGHLQVNPHLAGIDGAFELSASGTAYAIARQIDSANIDLSGLAIAGIVGDKQQMIGANREVLEEALRKGVVSIKRDFLYAYCGGTETCTLGEILEYNFEPYLEITGDAQKIEEFLKKIKLKPQTSYSDLNEEEKRRFLSAVMLKAMKRSSAEALAELIGEAYLLNKEVYPQALGFANLLNACGKLGKTGLALSLCLRDKTQLEEAKKYYHEYQRRVIAELKAIEGKVKQLKAIQYVQIKDAAVTSSVSSCIMRYISPALPLLVLSEEAGKIKVSARGSRKLVENGLDLGAALRIAAERAQGTGGGHSIASGASIPKGMENIFIQAVEEIVAKQLKIEVKIEEKKVKT
ncbi:MAG: DHH family phosphoesterase [Halobacteria archaeon]